MKIKLLCIDLFCDYGLIDVVMLSKLGVEPHFVYLKDNLKPPIVGSFSHEVSKFNYDELIKLVNRIGPSRLVCFTEELFPVVARINDELKLSGMTVKQANVFSNKAAMMDRVSGSLQCPRTTLIDESTTFDELKEELISDEIICKPVNQSGSSGVYHIKTKGEFTTFINDNRECLSYYLAQNYITKDLVHCELVIQDEAVLFSSARKYSNPNLKMVKESRPIFSCNIVDSSLKKTITDAAISVQKSIGLKNGIMHTEFFLDKECHNLIFLETNLRSPGIGLNHMYKDMIGISFETILCLIVCNIKVPQFEKSLMHYACGYYPVQKGVVKGINQFELGVESNWTYFAKEGDVLGKKNTMSKLAMVVCKGSSMEAVGKAEKALEKHRAMNIEEL